jgi:FkbM family methyltransferase
MLNYFEKSIKRKIARRITKKYPVRIDSFQIENYGSVRFANWENPLVQNIIISSEQVMFFEKFLEKGDFAIDIGANIGQMTIPLSLATGPNGLTLGFDPNPYVFEILTENAKLNPDKTNIIAYNYAITDKDGDFYYNSSEASFNNGGISKQKNNLHGKYSLDAKIRGINLESFLQANYSDRIHDLKLIKIDTEGYDGEIIRSVSNLLEKYKPALITECFGKNSAEAKFEQFELLKSKGYALYYFSDFISNAEIIPINRKEDMLKWGHFDLYAIIE